MWRSSLLVALLLTTLVASAEVSIDELGWLAGCWSIDDGEPGSVEHWLEPAGGAMLAVSRMIRDGRMVSYEFLRIEETNDGSLRLIAAPVGQAVTAFMLAKLDDQSVVFENLSHDFPQRISYRRVDDERLEASAESDNEGETVGFRFPMTRIDCQTDR